MRKTLLIVSVVIALVGCESDLDSVKNGVMEFNQTTTLGKVLDNWKSCEQRNWEEFETDNGVKVVQFSCYHKITQYMSKAKSLLSQEEQAEADHLDITSNVQTFQFTMNQDGSFQIDNVQVKITWKDGKSFEDSQKPVEQLETAYENQLNFESAELNKRSVKNISYVFSIIKAKAS